MYWSSLYDVSLIEWTKFEPVNLRYNFFSAAIIISPWKIFFSLQKSNLAIFWNSYIQKDWVWKYRTLFFALRWFCILRFQGPPVRAVIVPHAGYRYCGACAGYSYSQIDCSNVRILRKSFCESQLTQSLFFRSNECLFWAHRITFVFQVVPFRRAQSTPLRFMIYKLTKLLTMSW